ncbi:MAG: hypothetical protein PHW96_01685 [Candidatus Nanoarchaeia archaeon]|nr:hypothetical protein [Candidatus Nanoarchaeia archaeon]
MNTHDTGLNETVNALIKRICEGREIPTTNRDNYVVSFNVIVEKATANTKFSRLELLVNPVEDEECPVRRVIYPAVIPIEKHDLIRVYIFTGIIVNEEALSFHRCYPLSQHVEAKYITRKELKETETAFKIQKIKQELKSLDIAVEYIHW